MISQPAAPPAPDAAGISQARQDLGRRLAAARTQAGYGQHAFAPLTGYARSTVSEIELGRHLPGRGFWERCEQVLGLAPGHLTAPYDRLAPHGPGLRIRRGAARPVAMVIVWDDGTATTRLLGRGRGRDR